MKRYERLGAVMRLREIREQRARASMLREQLERAKAAQEVQSRRAAMAAIRHPLEEIRPATLRSLQLRGLAANEMLAEAVDQELEMIQRLDAARRQWHRMVADRDATEELLTRRAQAAAYLARSAADRSMDDLVAARSWRRR